MSALLSARGLAAGHGRGVLFSDLSLDVAPGESVGILGGNGSGKSTLLRTLVGLHRPHAGEVRRGAALRVGYLPQRDAIDPVFPFRALDVVLMASVADAWLPFTGGAARRRTAEEALRRVDMEGRAGESFRDLSGGQKQRVLLARALATAPTLLALDEPATGLDPGAERSLLSLLGRLRREEGLAVLMVSHSLDLVRREADRCVLLHEGRHRVGTAEEVLSPDALAEVFRDGSGHEEAR
jgi:ABC-type Mn2+/Zn2+ transport system ATPase subunit